MRIAGAHLATEDAKYGLAERYGSARAFQNRVAEWVHDGTEPVAVLRAPTGAGKTETFHELIDTHEMTLLVYPTNALLRQQHERFESDGVAAAKLNSTTLEGHGHERTEALLEFVNKYAADHEVVLTNPDILQAAMQDMYRGNKAMRFFNQFDAIVYDEFHFYNALAASGLLLQTKIIVERHAAPKVLLASATPNEDFVGFLRERVGIDVDEIDAEYAEDGDQFRRAVEVVRHEPRRLFAQREEIAASLQDELASVGTYEDPHVVLIFNSAKDSNDFHAFLNESYPSVFEHTEKDNGFDTNDDTADLDEEEFYILNTTSKGEVGLDYDITTLYMENPGESGAFLQRFGRAGRASEATVHIYGLGQGPWGNDVDFPMFTQQIADGIQGSQMDLEWLADLIGFRGAYALAARENSPGWFNQELREDFSANIDRYDRWRGFIATIENEIDEITTGFEAGKYTEKSDEAKLLRFTRQCFKGFRGLRGRSLPAAVKYPRGDRIGLTTYDLTRTLRHYDIDHVEDDDVLVLAPHDENSHSVVTARLPEYETHPTKYDRPTTQIEDEFQRKIRRHIDQVALNDDFATSTELLHRFFAIIRITDAIVPRQITTGEYDIAVDAERNGPPTIDVQQRHV